MKTAVSIISLTLCLLLPRSGHCFCNPNAGRWLSRDPAREPGFRVLQRANAERAGHGYQAPSPPRRWFNGDTVQAGDMGQYGFVMNAPVNGLDVLGLDVAKGGFMQMNCRQPCEDYKRSQISQNGEFSDAGGIVCCGGVKFVCVWGADRESNPRVREIVKRCIGLHERRHLDSVECKDCVYRIYRPPFKPSSQGRPACEEEMNDHADTKSCFEAALSECGGDQSCIDRLNDWIASEQRQYEYFKRQCDLLRK